MNNSELKISRIERKKKKLLKVIILLDNWYCYTIIIIGNCKSGLYARDTPWCINYKKKMFHYDFSIIS